eukprot:scaffold6247_cov77-Skeletonema_menzelii.AAC.1
MNDQSKDNLAVNEVMQKLIKELRQQYGLADNRFGNRVIEKVVGQSNHSISIARNILSQYIDEMKRTDPRGYDELIILKFMDDSEGSESEKKTESGKKRQTRDGVPLMIAYMEYTQYRPRLE